MMKPGSKIKNIQRAIASEYIDFCASIPAIRNRLIPKGMEHLRRHHLDENPHNNPPRVQELRYITMRNLLKSYADALNDGRISPRVRRAFVKNLIGQGLMGEPDRQAPFIERYGYEPPAWMTISPTQVCNLRCEGCYAASHDKTRATLPYDIFMKVLEDKRKAWGSHFTVISGGEPLLYRSQGKNIFDCLAHAHQDYHLMYSNGVLIDRDAAKRMADLGNVTVAISVEGWEEETTARRGKGVYQKILAAMDHLRAEGVPFGVSLTAMRHNAELLMSDEFLNFWFDEQGAIYGWLFQYMPIGRGITLDDMVTSDQRRWMLDRLLKLLYDDGRFMVDFWNGGPLSEGCIAAGRQGGYFYLDWNGDISPCVFMPYAAANIKDLYAEGKDLSAVLESGFFKEIRAWQDSYYGKTDGTAPENLFMPCPMRDHHDVAHNCAVEHGARPTNPEAAEALEDEDYRDGLRQYGEELSTKLAPYWGDGGSKVRGDLYGIVEVPTPEVSSAEAPAAKAQATGVPETPAEAAEAAEQDGKTRGAKEMRAEA